MKSSFDGKAAPAPGPSRGSRLAVATRLVARGGLEEPEGLPLPTSVMVRRGSPEPAIRDAVSKHDLRRFRQEIGVLLAQR